MLSGTRSGALTAGVCAGLLALLAPPAVAQLQLRADGALSPRLVGLAKPAVQAKSVRTQAAILDVARRGPGSLLRRNGRVLVEVRFSDGAAARAANLEGRGGEVVHISPRYQTVTAAVLPEDLQAISEVSAVANVTEVLAPIVSATGDAPRARTSAAPCAGAATSEGDSQLRAAEARDGFGIDGSGVTVGLLSDSFNRNPGASTRLADDIASGDLPGAVNPCGHAVGVDVVDDPAVLGVTDEGRAMAQLVHDLAPAARLSFATAFTSLTAFADNVRRLRGGGADVLVDDVSYYREPFFQEGPAGVAVSDVVADGASYFSSAGNAHAVDSSGRGISSWESSQFRSIGANGSCPAELAGAIGNPKDCLDFDPGGGDDPDFAITVASDTTLTVDLQWAQPWNGVTTDLDAYLLNETGGQVAGGFENNVSDPDAEVPGTGMPVEVLTWTNSTGTPQTVRLLINQCTGGPDPPDPSDPPCNPFSTADAPRLKFVLFSSGGRVVQTEYPSSAGGDVTGPTVTGHSGTDGAISVAAVPFSNSGQIEPFSSRGPATHYFAPARGTSPAPAFATPRTIPKPDLAATDGVRNTFFPGGCLVCRFFGTSASAPHAAAVAALVRSSNPFAGSAQVRDALTSTARPVGSYGHTAAGAGLVDAVDAVGKVISDPVVTIDSKLRRWIRDPTPTFRFSSSRPLSFECAIDGRLSSRCESPHTTARLRQGPHAFSATGTDIIGRRGAGPPQFFIVDTKRPRTGFAKRPRRVVRTRKRTRRVRFVFRSNERGVRYRCKLDRQRRFRRCGRRVVRRLRQGRHVVRVSARDRAGNVDRTPAILRFVVRRIPRG